MVAHSHPPADTGDLVAQLRARGMRVTPQREQVLTAVRTLGHGTPEQILEAVDGVDLATVYRNLDLLEDLGFVRHAHLGHGAPSYRPVEDDHIHVVCHTCGTIVDAEPVLVDELATRLRDDSGFRLDRSHFTVFGQCRECLAAAEQSPPAER